MRTLHIFVLLLLFITSCKNTGGGDYDKNKDGSITWIEINTAGSILNSDQKPYIIDVYTDWCGWCKVMDNKTFTHPDVIKLMDTHFHSVKFNAEMRESVNFGGEKYDWVPQGRNGVNALAVQLLGQRLSYPSFVILDANRNKLGIINGYRTPEQFIPELNQYLNATGNKS